MQQVFKMHQGTKKKLIKYIRDQRRVSKIHQGSKQVIKLHKETKKHLNKIRKETRKQLNNMCIKKLKT